MDGRWIVVTGIANERSIATAVATAVAARGARLVCTWEDERRRERVERVARAIRDDALLLPLDVRDDAQLQALGDELSRRNIVVAGVLHAIAFARLQENDGAAGVLAVDRARFAEALEVSAHSLALLCRTLSARFAADAAVVALSYLGATRALAGYDLMGVAKAALEAEVRYLAGELGPRGVRVNAVSAGPVRTAASSGVPGFAERLRDHAARAPLRRNVSATEVAEAAAFLLSPQASGITGQILFVDAGFSVV